MHSYNMLVRPSRAELAPPAGLHPYNLSSVMGSSRIRLPVA